MPPKKMKFEKEDDEYKKRRDRNNIAVRKSREKARQKQKETNQKVQQLRDENDRLEQKVIILNKELSMLKDLFLTQAYTENPIPDTNGSVQNQTSQEPLQIPEVEAEVAVEDIENDEESGDDPKTPVNTHALWKDHEYSIPSVGHGKS